MNDLSMLDSRYEIFDSYIFDKKTDKKKYPRIWHRENDILLKCTDGKFRHFSFNRLVFEKFTKLSNIGCLQIHHINKIKEDNRFFNLVGLFSSEHKEIHHNKYLKGQILKDAFERR